MMDVEVIDDFPDLDLLPPIQLKERRDDDDDEEDEEEDVGTDDGSDEEDSYNSMLVKLNTKKNEKPGHTEEAKKVYTVGDDFDVDDEDENIGVESDEDDSIFGDSSPMDVASQHTEESDDEADDDTEDLHIAAQSLEKLKQGFKDTLIADYHPESKMLSYEEIALLSHVSRNDEGEIVDPLHKTLPFLTKYEKARVLGERAKQIDQGATPMIEIATDVVDGYMIAQQELAAHKIPFILQRPLPGRQNGCEYWKLSDLLYGS